MVSDPDARWGVKRSSRAKEGGPEYDFGYMLHVTSDAVHGIPLGFTVTPANVNDSPGLSALVQKVLDDYSWVKPRTLTAGKGYDSETNHRSLFDRGIIPVIHVRKPMEHDGLYDGVYNAEGKPVCLGNVPMHYVRTDPDTGLHLFRCPAGGCLLKQSGTKAITHCTPRYGRTGGQSTCLEVLPRFTPQWKRLYRLRMSIERIFSSVKHSIGLEGHCVGGLRKIKLLATHVGADLPGYGPGAADGQGRWADAEDVGEARVD